MHRWTVYSLCVVVLATGCGSTGLAAAPADPTVSAAETAGEDHDAVESPAAVSRAGSSDEDQIMAVVRRFYEVAIEANNPPNPNSSLWTEVATDELTATVSARSAEKLASGEGTRLAESSFDSVIAPKLVLLEADMAVINTCIRDDAVRYDLATGEVLDSTVGFVWVQHGLTRTGAGWRISTTNNVSQFDQEGPCVSEYR